MPTEGVEVFIPVRTSVLIFVAVVEEVEEV